MSEMYALYEQEVAKLPKKPKHIDSMAGCKVGWYVYRTMKEAKIASLHARLEGEYRSMLGYDFGYCSPGEISVNHKKRRYTVTFP
jgi:hypothetical protein